MSKSNKHKWEEEGDEKKENTSTTDQLIISEPKYVYQSNIAPGRRRKLIQREIGEFIGNIWIDDLGRIVSEYTVSQFDCQCISIFVEPLKAKAIDSDLSPSVTLTRDMTCNYNYRRFAEFDKDSKSSGSERWRFPSTYDRWRSIIKDDEMAFINGQIWTWLSEREDDDDGDTIGIRRYDWLTAKELTALPWNFTQIHDMIDVPRIKHVWIREEYASTKREKATDIPCGYALRVITYDGTLVYKMIVEHNHGEMLFDGNHMVWILDGPNLLRRFDVHSFAEIPSSHITKQITKLDEKFVQSVNYHPDRRMIVMENEIWIVSVHLHRVHIFSLDTDEAQFITEYDYSDIIAPVLSRFPFARPNPSLHRTGKTMEIVAEYRARVQYDSPSVQFFIKLQ